MKLQPLDPRLLHLLLEGEEDVLNDRAKKRTAAIEFQPCPRCRGTVQEILNGRRMFTEGEVLPRTLGECKTCGYTYDPHSGLVMHTGDPREGIQKDPFAIHPSDD